MNIVSLKSLVSNGWTIANRKSLSKVIGNDELKNLGKLFKKLNSREFADGLPSLSGSGHTVWIPSGEINLTNRSGQFMLSFPVSISDLYFRNNTQHFIGKDINANTIKSCIENFESKVVNYYKHAKELPPSALESQTMKKLYTPKYNAPTRLNEDGMHVTTIIDKVSGKPVEAYVQPLERRDNFECWGIFVKDKNNQYELIGKRSFGIDRKRGKLTSDWMDSKGGSDRYQGIGLRLHQLGVERMMQENLNTVEICAEAQAYPFHYKSGFRVIPIEAVVSDEKLKKFLDFWARESGIPMEVLEKNVVSRVENGKTIINMKTYENFRNLLYLKNNGKYVYGDTYMCLQGEWLDKWKQMSKMQPILLK